MKWVPAREGSLQCLAWIGLVGPGNKKTPARPFWTLWRPAGNRTSEMTNKSGRLWSTPIFVGCEWSQWNQREGAHSSSANWRCMCPRWNWVLSRQEMCICVQSKEQQCNTWWKTEQNQSNLGENISRSQRQWYDLFQISKCKSKVSGINSFYFFF